MYIWDINMVSTVPADVQAPNGAWPSAETVLTTKLNGNFNKFSLAVYDFKYIFGGQIKPSKFIWLMRWEKYADQIHYKFRHIFWESDD